MQTEYQWQSDIKVAKMLPIPTTRTLLASSWGRILAISTACPRQSWHPNRRSKWITTGWEQTERIFLRKTTKKWQCSYPNKVTHKRLANKDKIVLWEVMSYGQNQNMGVSTKNVTVFLLFMNNYNIRAKKGSMGIACPGVFRASERESYRKIQNMSPASPRRWLVLHLKHLQGLEFSPPRCLWWLLPPLVTLSQFP